MRTRNFQNTRKRVAGHPFSEAGRGWTVALMLFGLSAVSACIPVAQSSDDADGDGYTEYSGECNDQDASIHPEAQERCNGEDDNCNGESDEGLIAYVWYLDRDKDGFGNAATTSSSCAQPAGYVDNADDCDDETTSINPTGTEVCNAVDDDCNGYTDNVSTTYYVDSDLDGYGNAAEPLDIKSCNSPQGYSKSPTDCNDANALIHPAASEIPGNGIDENCNGITDEGSLWYQDKDQDGFGNPKLIAEGNSQPDGYVSIGGDCDDSNDLTYPGAAEQCNGEDDDCDGDPDDGLPRPFQAYRDRDGDAFGAWGVDSNGRSLPPLRLCILPEDGVVLVRGDCNDEDSQTHPGAADGSNDQIDQDCGGTNGPDPHIGYSTSAYQNIERALQDASNLTTIWVGPGAYEESQIQFPSADVALRSSHLASNTLVMGAGGVGFRFEGISPTSLSKAILEGFTLVNGSPGVQISNASPRLYDLVIKQASGYGLTMTQSDAILVGVTVRDCSAGMRIESSNPTLINLVIEKNGGSTEAGGMYILNASPRITNGVITANRSSRGAGIFIQGGAPEFVHCLISHNSAQEHGAVYLGPGSHATFHHSIIAKNTLQSSNPLEDGGGIYVVDSESSRTLELTCSLVSHNTGYQVFVASTLDYSHDYGRSVLYAVGGKATNVSYSDSMTVEQDPQFMKLSSSWEASNFHVDYASPAVGLCVGEVDIDATQADAGMYGGTSSVTVYGGLDLDGDHFEDYFWPGDWADPPLSYDHLSYDCDDADSSTNECF